jgi:hypothetical protein
MAPSLYSGPAVARMLGQGLSGVNNRLKKTAIHFDFLRGFFGLVFLASPNGIPSQQATMCKTIPPL